MSSGRNALADVTHIYYTMWLAGHLRTTNIEICWHQCCRWQWTLSVEMGKNPHCWGSVLFGLCEYQGSVRFGFYNCQGSVLFGSKMSVLLHCKIAYTTEENVVLLGLKCIEIMQCPLYFKVHHQSCINQVPCIHLRNQVLSSWGSVLFVFLKFFLHPSSSSVRFYSHL